MPEDRKTPKIFYLRLRVSSGRDGSSLAREGFSRPISDQVFEGVIAMFRLILPLVLGCVLASGAAATPVTDIQEGYTPSSRTSQAITGPIIISRDKIVFGTGDVVALKVISEGQRGGWGDLGETQVAQIFEMQSDPGGLVDDISLCGSGKPVRYLTVYQDQVFGTWVLSLAFYSGDTPPTQVDNPDLCGTFGYEMIRPVPEGL